VCSLDLFFFFFLLNIHIWIAKVQETSTLLPLSDMCVPSRTERYKARSTRSPHVAGKKRRATQYKWGRCPET